MDPHRPDISLSMAKQNLKCFFLDCDVGGQLSYNKPGNIQGNDDMAMPTILPPSLFSERNTHWVDDAIRRRALQRLYKRRAAVLSLIQALEAYQLSAQSTSYNT
jgi:hypothetical protein